ncbi:MAG: hypothetical protein JWP97_5910 [Labilithrix sp.]|nr:hypothetical protein [Labilithrix sp.]
MTRHVFVETSQVAWRFMHGLAAPQFCGYPPPHIVAHSSLVGMPPANGRQRQLHGSRRTLQSVSFAQGPWRGDGGSALAALAVAVVALAEVPPAVLPLGDGRVEQPATATTNTVVKLNGTRTRHGNMASAMEARYDRSMAMSRADGFLIPLLAGEVGIPMEGMYVLGTLAGSDGALGERMARYLDMFRQTGAAVGAQVVDVEARLVRSGLTPPVRPDSYPLYVRWSDEAARLVASITGPDTAAGALAGLGRIVGELMQTVATQIAVLDLRELAPDHAVLLLHHTQLTARTAKHIERLQGMAQFPSLPADVVPHAARLATLARMAGVLIRKTELGTQAQASGLKLAAGQLGTTIRSVRALVEA